jgi:hypothetical protein
VKLAARQPDGQTLREHLLAAAAAGAPVDDLLTTPPPQGAEDLWQAFVDLSASRPAGMGPAGIPPSEIVAWQTLCRLRLTPWECETLLAMDRAVLAELERQRTSKGPPP